MNVISKVIVVKTKADGAMHDLSKELNQALKETKLLDGIVTVFCQGSTVSISTVEFEPGLCQDIPALMEKIAPKDYPYAHHETWQDDNGRSHVKATLMGPSLTIPFTQGKLTLGTWQQVAIFEWDTRPRTREIVLQFIGT